MGGRRIEACGSLSVYVSHRTCQFIGSTATKSISVLHSRINHFLADLKCPFCTTEHSQSSNPAVHVKEDDPGKLLCCGIGIPTSV